jgi:NAD(P)-dependent dehydrogenase (short-subunit alcohol dehydrogenase family)
VNIAGKGALVTGGASGLGLATARSLHEAGASIVIADLASSDGETAAKELGERAAFAATDVTSEQDASRAVAAAADGFGGLHIVVNCAGVATPGRVLRKDGRPLALASFESVVRVNLLGTFNIARLAAAQMARQEPVGEERGVIVNTASIAAFEGQIGQVAYAASKAGIVGLTLPLARDLSERLVRCVAIAPGTFDTPMLAGLGDEVRDALARAIPHPARLGAPDEFAALVRHVIENPMLNGSVIRLDGALRMAPR